MLYVNDGMVTMVGNCPIQYEYNMSYDEYQSLNDMNQEYHHHDI